MRRDAGRPDGLALMFHVEHPLVADDLTGLVAPAKLLPLLESISDQLDAELRALEAQGRRRRLPHLTRTSLVDVVADEDRLTSFSSNDYLGLTGHPALLAAATLAAQLGGFGAGSARLVAGDHPEHRALETAVASLLRLPAALLFPTGYQANLGVLTALAGPSDLIVADRAVHASLIDGCRLSRAKLAFYPHLQLDKAEHHLSRLGPKARRRFLLTESLFSMDGDVAPLSQLASLAKAYDAALIVDEAHAIGTLGPVGAGLCAHDQILPDVLIGTFGKAFGSSGAFVAGSSLLRDYLINRARTFIFTTAIPIPVAAAARQAATIISSPEGDALRSSLAANVAAFRSAIGLPRDPASSPIVPIILGADDAALRASAQLRALGLFTQAIRPPTVREGTARLRLTFSAAHTPAHIDCLAEAIRTLLHPSTPKPQPDGAFSNPAPLFSSVARNKDRQLSLNPTQLPPLPKTSPLAPPRGLFLVGTDTAVGKTAVATGLLTLMVRRGLSPVPFKPVESGADPEPSDAAALRIAADRLDIPMDVVCPIPLRHPIAPAAAARLEGVQITLPNLLAHFAAAAAQGSPVVAESAGGLLSPYTHTLTGADLAAAFGMPVLLIARNALGTVNHTALALAEIRRRNLPFLGLILVDTTGADSHDPSANADLIADLTGVRALGVLPHIPSPTPILLAQELDRSVDLLTLWTRLLT